MITCVASFAMKTMTIIQHMHGPRLCMHARVAVIGQSLLGSFLLTSKQLIIPMVHAHIYQAYSTWHTITQKDYIP